jgi:hypothetical protein
MWTLTRALTKWGRIGLCGIWSFERAVGDAIVMADLPLLLDAQDVVEVDAGNGGEGRASPAGGTAKRALWAGR